MVHHQWAVGLALDEFSPLVISNVKAKANIGVLDFEPFKQRAVIVKVPAFAFVRVGGGRGRGSSMF